MKDKHETMLKRILYACAVVYVITLAYSFYYNMQQHDQSGIWMSALAIIIPFIIPILFYVCKFKVVYEIYIISTIFTYFASLLGSGLHWYSYFGFDKVLHFFSGCIFLIFAIILYFHIRKSNMLKDKKDYPIFVIFINAVNLAIAVIWEFFEYAMLVFFNNDGINHYKSGVHDSMQDMLCASLAGILLTLLILYDMHNKKRNWITNIYHKFYERNTLDE